MGSLLELNGGMASLEISESDIAIVKQLIIEMWGVPKVTRHPACDSLEFAGESFTFQNDWNDPCLIADTNGGREILRILCERLNAR
jgi:hypothetical protein